MTLHAGTRAAGVIWCRGLRLGLELKPDLAWRAGATCWASPAHRIGPMDQIWSTDQPCTTHLACKNKRLSTTGLNRSPYLSMWCGGPSDTACMCSWYALQRSWRRGWHGLWLQSFFCDNCIPGIRQFLWDLQPYSLSAVAFSWETALLENGLSSLKIGTVGATDAHYLNSHI